MQKRLNNGNRPKESEAMAMAKGRNKFDFPNAFFSAADDFMMEVGLIEDTFNNQYRKKQREPK